MGLFTGYCMGLPPFQHVKDIPVESIDFCEGKTRHSTIKVNSLFLTGNNAVCKVLMSFLI